MLRFQPLAAVLLTTISCLLADEPAKEFQWTGPKVVVSVFTAELGMLDAERDEYATNLATVASNGIAAAKASPASLALGRNIIALALQLSPRNKRAVIVNFQLGKGILPETVQGNYSSEAFARVICVRGQVLMKQGGADNVKLGRYFIQLAAELDPRNEEAVYASELQRLDHGVVNWAALADGAVAE